MKNRNDELTNSDKNSIFAIDKKNKSQQSMDTEEVSADEKKENQNSKKTTQS